MIALPVLSLLGGCTADGIDSMEGYLSEFQLESGLAWSGSSCEAVIGAENAFPSLSNPHGLSVSYTSSDTDVAVIDSNGSITLLSAGSTAISANSEATSAYLAGSVSYALTVSKSENGISWSAGSWTVTFGDESGYTFPILVNPGGQSVSYLSSNPSVATIDSEGTVGIVGEGETTITATSKANDAYESGSASYILTVEGVLEPAGFYWSVESCTATLASDGNTYPELVNPNGLDISFTTSNEEIATVDGRGVVALVGAGTVSVIATSDADMTYAAGSAAYTLKVVKHDVSLAWSDSSWSVVLEESDGTFPTLAVDPSDSGIEIEYSSSSPGVATIGASGEVSLAGVGTTTISANFSGSDTYKSASASYKLVVTSNTDDGAGTFTYESSGGGSSEDDISNTTFSRKVCVTYSSSGASVTGYSASAALAVSVSGNEVTITNTGSENIVYELSGSASDGFFKLYSSKKQALHLKGLNLACSTGAAIDNQSGKRTFVYVEGTNTLSDGASAAYSTTGDEDMKAVFFSEGQLVFSGGGSLKVSAVNKKEKSCIASDDYVRIMDGPELTLSAGSSAGHGLKGNDYVQVSGGSLGITVAAAMKKGITSDGYVLVEDGTAVIDVSGGVAYDSDDAEYKGSAGIKADNYFGMTGGSVTIKNTGAGGKGVHAGSYSYVKENSTGLADSYVSGGRLVVTTSGKESNDVSCKAIKIGYKQKSGNQYLYGGNMTVSGGSIVLKVSGSEAFEVKGTLTFTGGDTYAYSAGDDAINSQGELDIRGGYVYAHSTANDAIDTNSDMKLSGGILYAVTTAGTPEVAVDANTEGGYKLYIESGATVIAYGGLERGYSASQSVYSYSGSANAWNALHSGSAYLSAFKAPSGISTFILSAPSLSSGYKGVSVSGTTYCNGMIAASGISGGSSVGLSSYSGGNSGGGGHGGGWPGGGGRH